MVNELEKTSLSDLSIDISYGYTESASPNNIGPRFLRITDIQNGIVDWKNVPYCRISIDNHEKYKLDFGDIVVARTGNSTGENYLFQEKVDAVFASYLIRFRIDKTKADARYVWYSLRSPEWWSFVDNSKTGSAQAGANAKVLGRFLITLPALPEQRVIAHILGTLDDRIELNRRMNETLELMARTLFKAWFVDFEPVRAKLEGRWRRGQSFPGLPAHLYDIFPDRLVESESGEIPEGWEISAMRSLSEVISKGTTPNKKDLASVTDEPVIPFIKVRDISQSDGILRKNLELIAKSIHETSLKRSILKTDDLLFSIAGTIGRTAYIDSDLNGANANQAIAFIRLKDSRNYFSLCWLNLRSDKTQNFINTKIVQGVQANASLESIGNIPVTIPDQAALMQWNEVIAPIISQYRTCQQENRILTQLRDTLLPRLVSGDLRVPDVECIAGMTR